MSTPRSLAERLAQSPLFGSLSSQHLHKLAETAQNRRLQAGTYLFREGRPATELYIIRRGKLQLQVHSPPRGAVTLETIHPGGLLGWSSLLPPGTWASDGYVLKDGLAFALDAACLGRKFQADPVFAQAVLRVVLAQVARRLERSRLHQLDVYRSPLDPAQGGSGRTGSD